MREIEGPVPAHLRGVMDLGLWCLHSAAWWRRHRDWTGIMDVALADVLPDGWRFWAARDGRRPSTIQIAFRVPTGHEVGDSRPGLGLSLDLPAPPVEPQ